MPNKISLSTYAAEKHENTGEKTRFQHTDPNLVDWDSINITMRDMTIAQK